MSGASREDPASEEQLRRIEDGVMDRIRARAALARRIAGTAAAVVLLVGGVLLLRPEGIGSAGAGGSSSSSGSGSGSSAAGGSSAGAGAGSSGSGAGSRAGRGDAPALRGSNPSDGPDVDFQSGSGRASAASVRCYRTASIDSVPTVTTVERNATTAAVLAACARALDARSTAASSPHGSAQVRPSSPSPAPAATPFGLAACIDGAGATRVLTSGASPASVCAANGLRPR